MCVHTKGKCDFIKKISCFLMNINYFSFDFHLFLLTLQLVKLQTKVEIRKSSIEIKPADNILFVGSCFADNIGKRFIDNKFRATVNPYGVMYNPASIRHTVERAVVEDTAGMTGSGSFDVAVFTLGTNHVYRLKETGEIVDNCQKRPQSLFSEEELTVEECKQCLAEAICMLRERNAEVRVIVTVSPIRYAKYGFHGSQLSKATLQLAADALTKEYEGVEYFPAYEIMNDELRDYRFYEPDMLHPSPQAVDYIYEQFKAMFFSAEACQMEEEWQPIRRALNHRPFDAESDEYKSFLARARADEVSFIDRWKL